MYVLITLSVIAVILLIIYMIREDDYDGFILFVLIESLFDLIVSLFDEWD